MITNGVRASHVITAFHWLGVTMQAFSPARIDDAASYLGLPAGQLALAVSAAEALSARVGGVKSVSLAVHFLSRAP